MPGGLMQVAEAVREPYARMPSPTVYGSEPSTPTSTTESYGPSTLISATPSYARTTLTSTTQSDERSVARFKGCEFHVYTTVHTRNPGHMYKPGFRPPAGILRSPSVDGQVQGPSISRKISFADEYGRVRRSLALTRRASAPVETSDMPTYPDNVDESAQLTRTFLSGTGHGVNDEVFLHGNRMLVRPAGFDGSILRNRKDQLDRAGCFSFVAFRKKERINFLLGKSRALPKI